MADLPENERQRLQALKAQTSALKRPWVSEIVLQTNQYDRMKLWYEAVLGGDWFVENTPAPDAPALPPQSAGDKQAYAKDVRACFMRLPTVAPYDLTFALFELGWVSAAPTDDPGINHMQLKHADLEALIQRVELLDGADVMPHRSANHGPMTSFYYRDPDKNIVELCIDNFRTPEEMNAIIQSPAFRANPSGIDLDHRDFIARYRSGVPERDLLALE